MKIGVFGGAFNPVHNGHLHLIEVMKRAPMQPDFTFLDKIILIPTANPPHRTDEVFASGEDRINMLTLAVGSNDLFRPDIDYNIEISDIEFRLEGKSYSFNTLTELKKLYPDDELYLFMGSDQLLSFKSWYKYSGILKLARVAAISRCSGDTDKIKRYLEDNTEFKDRVFIVSSKPLEVSSTEIRAKIKNGESAEGLLPKAVEDYIKERGLYV